MVYIKNKTIKKSKKKFKGGGGGGGGGGGVDNSSLSILVTPRQSQVMGDSESEEDDDIKRIPPFTKFTPVRGVRAVTPSLAHMTSQDEIEIPRESTTSDTIVAKSSTPDKKNLESGQIQLSQNRADQIKKNHQIKSAQSNGNTKKTKLKKTTIKSTSSSTVTKRRNSQVESNGKIKKSKDEDSSPIEKDIEQQTSSGQQNIDLDSGVPIINLANNINKIGNILPEFEPLPVLVGLVGLGILLTM